MWVPDVYQGAPTPVTAFLSVGSKAAGFVVLTRALDAFMAKGSIIADEVQGVLLVGGSLTVLLGSLPAIYQTSVKRLLAYSSISHAGYLLLALACGGDGRFGLGGSGIVAFYLATYLPMTVLGFLALGVMRLNGQGEDLGDFQGLAKRSPVLALVITVAMGRMSFAALREAVEASLKATVMILLIVAGAKLFAFAITLYLIPQQVSGLLADNKRIAEACRVYAEADAIFMSLQSRNRISGFDSTNGGLAQLQHIGPLWRGELHHLGPAALLAGHEGGL